MRKPSKNARLISARMTAVQSIYQMAISDVDARSAYQDYVENRMGKEQEGDNYVPANLELLSKIILGVDEKRDVIRDMVLGALNGQKPEPLLQAILFCGIYELIDNVDVDAPVIINDYVNVTHGFFDQSEADLINAILDRQAKNLRV